VGALLPAELNLAPQATAIVVPATPDPLETKAAEFLRDYLRKAHRVSAGFDIHPESGIVPKTGPVIAIGRTQWAPRDQLAKLWRDGFVIRSSANRVVIAGASPAGTFYGAARFLDQFAGVRFYLPGELFVSLPKAPPGPIPEVDISEEPYVRNSMMSGVAGFSGTGGVDPNAPRPAEADWLLRNAVFRKESVHFSHQHSMFQRFPPAVFAARYPEIYPTLNGKRYIPADNKDQQWQPCLTEPKLVDAAVESAESHFRQNPTLHSISFSIQDSRKFCECTRCARQVELAGGARTRARTAMNAHFLNAVAERVPDKTLVYIAYNDVREIPPVKLRSNILPVFVTKISDLGIDLSEYAERNNILQEWAGAVTQMGHHDWGQGWMYLIPRLYTFMTSRFFREAQERKLTWGYQHFEAYPNWGMDGAKLWITARIWWNPRVDVNLLWQQFAADMFPSGRQEMFRYFMNLETLWVLTDTDSERKLRKWSNMFDLAGPAQFRLVKECRTLLDKARAQASSPEERQRVELFSKTYRVAEYLFEFANANTVAPSRIDEFRKYIAETIAPDPMTLYLAGNSAELTKEVEAALAVVTKGKL
jgi:hypothetical protein